MKRIILTTSLFFCLAITTILAQVVTTNIAAPVAGLSTNLVTDFDVNSDGTILNNSASGGTAQFGTTVTANSNITAGNEASLILFQVTGTSGSALDGTIEVFGANAGLIIANPIGISCDGCAFINTNRVDLVTGSGYDAGTNTFSTIAATDITVVGGLLANNVAVNIQTGADFNNNTTINADSLTVIAGGDFANNSGATINADTVTIEVTNFNNDISNTGTISSDSLNLILTADFTNNSNTLNGFNSFRNLTVTTEGYFLNSSALDLDNLTIKIGSIFENREQINADSFTAVVNSFINSLTINADNLNVIAEADFTNYAGVINAASFNVTAKDFITSSSSSIDADTVTIEVPNFDDISLRGIVSSDSLNIILTDDFTHTSDSFTNFNNFSDLAITTNGTFTNNATINPDGNLTIAANTFTNNATINPTGNLTITAGYTAINQGSIVSGNLDVITADFFRNLTGGDINVANLNIIAGGKVTNTANINVGTLTITANNDSTRTNDTTGFYVSNRGNITATSLNIAAVDNFYNRGNITATTFNITRAKSVFFLNKEINSFYAAGNTYDGGTISLSGDSSFIAADGSIENYGNIDLGSFNLDISADSFTNQAGANVTANTVNLINVNSFIDNGSITATINQ